MVLEYDAKRESEWDLDLKAGVLLLFVHDSVRCCIYLVVLPTNANPVLVPARPPYGVVRDAVGGQGDMTRVRSWAILDQFGTIVLHDSIRDRVHVYSMSLNDSSIRPAGSFKRLLRRNKGTRLLPAISVDIVTDRIKGIIIPGAQSVIPLTTVLLFLSIAMGF